jgi:hypothetical protein
MLIPDRRQIPDQASGCVEHKLILALRITHADI